MYRVTVTPDRVLPRPVSVERSSRTLREVHQRWGSTDRMLRAMFVGEDGVTPAGRHGLSPRVEQRLTRIFAEGLAVCGRRFEFLGFSPTQLKESCCWFFCPDELMGISADHVRAGMGDFTHLRSPSKVAARMGQCFSTTIHTLMVEPKGATAAGSSSADVFLWGELPDVVNGRPHLARAA